MPRRAIFLSVLACLCLAPDAALAAAPVTKRDATPAQRQRRSTRPSRSRPSGRLIAATDIAATGRRPSTSGSARRRTVTYLVEHASSPDAGAGSRRSPGTAAPTRGLATTSSDGLSDARRASRSGRTRFDRGRRSDADRRCTRSPPSEPGGSRRGHASYSAAPARHGAGDADRRGRRGGLRDRRPPGRRRLGRSPVRPDRASSSGDCPRHAAVPGCRRRSAADGARRDDARHRLPGRVERRPAGRASSAMCTVQRDVHARLLRPRVDGRRDIAPPGTVTAGGNDRRRRSPHLPSPAPPAPATSSGRRPRRAAARTRVFYSSAPRRARSTSWSTPARRSLVARATAPRSSCRASPPAAPARTSSTSTRGSCRHTVRRLPDLDRRRGPRPTTSRSRRPTPVRPTGTRPLGQRTDAAETRCRRRGRVSRYFPDGNGGLGTVSEAQLAHGTTPPTLPRRPARHRRSARTPAFNARAG